MDVSSTSDDDEITLLRTWALTVTHVHGDYTEQKFNAEKTGGDPVIPSPKPRHDLAYKNPQIDLPKDTGRNEEREEKLLERCPPGHEGTKLIDIPATILMHPVPSSHGTSQNALTDATQNEIWAASDLLAPMLEQSIKLDGIWRTNQQWFTPSSKMIISHYPEVSASLKGPSSEKSSKPLRPAAIATAALRVMHPEQYGQGCKPLRASEKRHEARNCRRCQRLSSTGQRCLNSLTIMQSGKPRIIETPHRFPNASIFSLAWGIILMLDEYAKPAARVKDDPGCMIAFSGRIVRHAVHAVEGDRIAWAWYMRDAVHVLCWIPSLDGQVSNLGFGLRVSGLDNRDSILDGRHSHLGLRESIVGTRVSRLGSWDSIVRIRVSRLGTRTRGFGTR
ncbi:hypothetical protein DFJ58DRAFT_846706 [Suillus subalutaceus]|uniref:uncharacterized protein n=1 Tax=Suillus subalutaceus TaxID=48586 RepID=UPI001B88662E|nr:uncharacterized protein DFJ58DRAFT_846706 [Suillus subalutaceus]KAG1836864.1 hypothetical protein DFJ58DRAFT_846706 [Suillus subalutaceus]